MIKGMLSTSHLIFTTSMTCPYFLLKIPHFPLFCPLYHLEWLGCMLTSALMASNVTGYGLPQGGSSPGGIALGYADFLPELIS